MGIHAPQVGQNQHVGAQFGVPVRHTKVPEYARHGGLQVFALNEFSLVVSYLELLQHGQSPIAVLSLEYTGWQASFWEWIIACRRIAKSECPSEEKVDGPLGPRSAVCGSKGQGHPAGNHSWKRKAEAQDGSAGRRRRAEAQGVPSGIDRGGEYLA